MSTRSLAFVLLFTWCQTGCEFRDESAGIVASEARTDLTFTWSDPNGPHEIIRAFELKGQELSRASVLPLASVPNAIVVRGLSADSGGCSAKLWVNGERPVRLDCVAVEGASEIHLRGFDLAIPDGVDGLHPVRIETGSSAVNFGVRSLPQSIAFKPVERANALHALGTATRYHQLTALEVPRGVAGSLKLQSPTNVAATVRRRITKNDYSFDAHRCVITPQISNADVAVPVDVQIVAESDQVGTEWPKLFSLESQLTKVAQEKSARLLVFAAHPFLDRVYGPAPYKETASVQYVEHVCSPDRGPYRTTVLAMPRETSADVRIGNDEIDPVLQLTLDGLAILDESTFSLDAKPVRRVLAPQSFEVVLSKDIP